MGRRWSASEDEKLRVSWGEVTVPDLAGMLRRTEWAVYRRARDLGISVGCPRGYEWLTAAARRTGYDVATLRSVLDDAGVAMRPALHRLDYTPRSGRVYVDPFDVDAAVAARNLTETLSSAATRRGIEHRRLIRALAGVDGVPRKPRRGRAWRIPTALLDLAMRGAA